MEVDFCKESKGVKIQTSPVVGIDITRTHNGVVTDMQTIGGATKLLPIT